MGPASLDTSLLIEQPALNGFRWIEEPVAVLPLVRFDLAHVKLPWRHRPQDRVEIVEVPLLRVHSRPSRAAGT
jgi:hypothetical protein